MSGGVPSRSAGGFIAVFTAGIGLAYVRFGSLTSEASGPAVDDAHRSSRGASSSTSRDSESRATGA